MLGFSITSGDAFGIFAGTAVNDTSSVTAAASTWDSMWSLGTATLPRGMCGDMSAVVLVNGSEGLPWRRSF